MDKVTVVTGPLRSGTSCVTGLLELCGFDLGRNVRVLRNPTEHNPKGHFETDLLFTINQRLLIESSGQPSGVFTIPPEEKIKQLVEQRETYFQLFIKRFDGNLCKDPLLCITLRHWENIWPELQRAVFCLRHPLLVAQSMQKRYGLSLTDGVQLWEVYTRRFFYSPRKTSAYVFDFDAFCGDTSAVFSQLLDWLGMSLESKLLQKYLDGFFLPEAAAGSVDDKLWNNVPQRIQELYQALKSSSGPLDSRVLTRQLNTCINADWSLLNY